MIPEAKQTIEVTVTQASAPLTPALPLANEAEKVKKVSKKKRKFAEMLGGSALVQDGMGQF